MLKTYTQMKTIVETIAKDITDHIIDSYIDRSLKNVLGDALKYACDLVDHAPHRVATKLKEYIPVFDHAGLHPVSHKLESLIIAINSTHGKQLSPSQENLIIDIINNDDCLHEDSCELFDCCSYAPVLSNEPNPYIGLTINDKLNKLLNNVDIPY